MTYLELMKDFWRMHDEQPFSALAAMLYFRLLEECNRRKWKNPFSLPSSCLEESVSPSRKTIGKARDELKARGLIDFVSPKPKPPVFFIEKATLNNPEIWPLSDDENRLKIALENMLQCFLNVSLMFLQCFRNVSVGNNDTYYNTTNVVYIYKDNEDDIGTSSSSSQKTADVFGEIEGLKTQQMWLEMTAARFHKTVEDILANLPKFANSSFSDGVCSHRDEADLKKHFNNWYRIQLRESENGKQKDRLSERRGFVPKAEVRKGFKGTL